MGTFNGKNDNLLFRCRDCGFGSTIEIDLFDSEDKDKLWNWLQTHSADGGDYRNVPTTTGLVSQIKVAEERVEELKEELRLRKDLRENRML